VTLTIKKTDFTQSTTNQKGGALYLKLGGYFDNELFDFDDNHFDSNQADWSGSTIYMISNNEKLINYLKLLKQSLSSTNTSNQSDTFENKLYPISSDVKNYIIVLTTKYLNQIPITMNGSFLEESSNTHKLRFLSGEGINMDVMFYDDFWSPNDDLNGLEFI
jgi:hypothetical protein